MTVTRDFVSILKLFVERDIHNSQSRALRVQSESVSRKVNHAAWLQQYYEDGDFELPCPRKLADSHQ